LPLKKLIPVPRDWSLKKKRLKVKQPIWREKLIGKSTERERRPTREELWALSRFFGQRKRSVQMLHIMWFAIDSARRLSEITRLEWTDNDVKKFTGLVRDAKHPRLKEGNHKRFKYLTVGLENRSKTAQNK